MSKGGCAALEAGGMVIAALSAQAMIRGLFSQDSEPLGGVLNGVPGGLAGRLTLLGLIALAGTASGGWAHIRQEPARQHQKNAEEQS
ncbi:hypothetical protein GCM10010182_01760 [Actinomadura cremea]|nr:hypothetical protein GCM10010182_01760 [Actinomadura cremea]